MPATAIGPQYFTLISALFLACAPSAPGPGAGSTIAEYHVLPSATNAAITLWDTEHYIWIDTASHRATRELLVLLPGTNGAPSNARLIGALAAAQGYDVIGLMYPDDLAVMQACPADPDPDCMAAMRTEIIDGVDLSSHVQVDPANSIDGRLGSLLQYLAAHHPAQGWEQYLSGNAPRWSAIAVGGLSQGGGHAAFIAKLRLVPRVVMFGAPADGIDGAAAPWIVGSATPASHYYGFAHLRDPFTSIPANWDALGLSAFGAAVQVEQSAPPFGNSHLLRTDLLPATGSYSDAHPSVYADGATPRATDGSPVFTPAWKYLLGTP